MNVLKLYFKKPQFYIFLIILLSCYSIFLFGEHYPTDSIHSYYVGLSQEYSSNILHANGRVIHWATEELSRLIGLSLREKMVSSLVFSIVTTAFTATLIYKFLIDKFSLDKRLQKTGIMIAIASIFISPFAVEQFYWFDAAAWSLAVLFSVIASHITYELFNRSKLNKKKVTLFIFDILAFLSLSLLGYQPNTYIYLVYSIVLIGLNSIINIKSKKHQETKYYNIKLLIGAFKKIIFIFSMFLLAIVLNMIIQKYIIHVSRFNSFEPLAIIDRGLYQRILYVFKLSYYKDFFYKSALIIQLIIIIQLLLITMRNRLRCLSIAALLAATLFICIFSLVSFNIISKGFILETRMIMVASFFPFFVALSTITLMRYKTNKHKINLIHLNILLLIFFFINLISILGSQNLSITQNKINDAWSDSIADVIKDYQNNNNTKINKMIYYRDSNFTYSNFPFDKGFTSLNLKSSATDWSTIESLYLYSGLKLNKLNVESNKYYQYKNYCETNNWEGFNLDQVKFSEDIAIVCIY